MRIEAPVGLLASLREEGYLRPRNWPELYSPAAFAHDDVALTVVIGDAVRDRDDLLVLPGATHVLAEVIANWWGAHQWLYDPHACALLFRESSEQLIGTIGQIAARIEIHCGELLDGHWWWTGKGSGNGTTPAIVWRTREATTRFILGDNIVVRYQSVSRRSSDRRTIGETEQALSERVALFDEARELDAVAVWLRFPEDVGTTLQELLAAPAPSGLLPRQLLLSLRREVHPPAEQNG